MSAALFRPQPLVLWFGLMAALANLAAFQAALFPRWPHARPLSAEAITKSLRRAGIPAERIPAMSDDAQGRRSHELATSAPLSYRLVDGSELRLLRGTARHRSNLQVAMFARDHKHFSLKSHQLEPGPPPLARGKIRGREVLQTCWVATATPGGAYGVTAAQLLPLVDSQALGFRAEWYRLIGLQANRDYSCVLISLRSGDADPIPLERVAKLLNALPAGLKIP